MIRMIHTGTSQGIIQFDGIATGGSCSEEGAKRSVGSGTNSTQQPKANGNETNESTVCIMVGSIDPKTFGEHIHHFIEMAQERVFARRTWIEMSSDDRDPSQNGSWGQ